jgi:hypothetical protein
MRERRDELSNEYYYSTIGALEDYFSITNRNLDTVYEKLKEQKGYFNKESYIPRV